MGLSDRAHRALWPVLLFFQAIGDIAWLPILLIWFGFGLTTMTFVIVYTVLFPVVLNTVLGVRSVPLELHRAALSLGASKARVLWEVVLPGALPNIMTGLRNGLGFGWRALIAAEIIVGTSGIGFLMFDARRAGSVVEILLGMIVLGVLWYVVDSWVLAPIERATGERWGLVTRVNDEEPHDRASAEDLLRSVRRQAGDGDPRHLARGRRRRLRRGGRAVGLRQDDDAQPDRRLPAAHRRARSASTAAPCSGPGPDRGVVFQSFALFPWRTVLDNVAFGPKMRGVPKARRHEIAREYLALAGLSHAAERYPNELSGGMQQRVGVVRALANEPDVLLMDEPFASVDAQTRMTLQEELTRIWEQRRPTVLFITHDVNEAVFLANRVVVLSQGTVLDDIAIDLPRPRAWDALIEDAGFKALSARVLQQVRAA